MVIAEQWESLRSDASSSVSKINSYRKLTPLCIKARSEGEGGAADEEWVCYSKFPTGDGGADQCVVKCFCCTFIMFDSDDNIVCTA